KKHFTMMFDEKWMIFLPLMWFAYTLGLPHLAPLATFYIILYFGILPIIPELKSNTLLLPVKRSQFVISKYFCNFIVASISILVTSLAINITYNLESDAGKLALLLNIIISLGGLALFMPFSFKIKTERLLAGIIICPVIFFTTYFGFTIRDVKDKIIPSPFDINISHIMLILLFFIVLYLISMKVAIKIFEKRELG
ncbi:MAG: ABC-2 transporter permease, partial [Sarcina sp.]